MDYTNELQILYKSVKREVAFSAHTRHPNIVQLLDVFADKERRTLVIVWEFIEGPDLLECLNRHGAALPEPEAAFYFAQLLRGLLFMHQTGFAHRDLKPENCVLEERTHVLKLIDFGLTKHIESARTMLVGTPEYMAPELVRCPTQPGLLRYAGAASEQGSLQSAGSAGSTASSSSITAQQQQQLQQQQAAMNKRYDARKVDAWALGVLLYVLVSAQYPFSDDSTGPGSAVAAQRALLSGRYRPIPSSVGAGARRIVQGLLVVDPAHRMDLEEVAQDPWLLSAAMEYGGRFDTQPVYDTTDVAARPWPIGTQALAAVKEESSLQPSIHSSYVQANTAAGGHAGWQQQQQQRRQQQQQQLHTGEDEYGRSECFCKGCVIC
ncbi:hypothetical protein OEZ85_011193 [Tetradesmus obliquus]|uniref:Protein kinase domain-containing protein n=1 Tax=Tetradesmus obliquus TaxID=3088 RepID=A0ABY8TPQ7_TETOB|nr:hypothetical protein OEZ85_011193 [Tetradesmus obliquus]